jgi:hypothetical protein
MMLLKIPLLNCQFHAFLRLTLLCLYILLAILPFATASFAQAEDSDWLLPKDWKVVPSPPGQGVVKIVTNPKNPRLSANLIRASFARLPKEGDRAALIESDYRKVGIQPKWQRTRLNEPLAYSAELSFTRQEGKLSSFVLAVQYPDAVYYTTIIGPEEFRQDLVKAFAAIEDARKDHLENAKSNWGYGWIIALLCFLLITGFAGWWFRRRIALRSSVRLCVFLSIERFEIKHRGAQRNTEY